MSLSPKSSHLPLCWLWGTWMSLSPGAHTYPDGGFGTCGCPCPLSPHFGAGFGAHGCPCRQRAHTYPGAGFGTRGCPQRAHTYPGAGFGTCICPRRAHTLVLALGHMDVPVPKYPPLTPVVARGRCLCRAGRCVPGLPAAQAPHLPGHIAAGWGDRGHLCDTGNQQPPPKQPPQPAQDPGSEREGPDFPG